MPVNVLYFLNYACECRIIAGIMPIKLVTYNSQSYASTLGSGLPQIQSQSM